MGQFSITHLPLAGLMRVVRTRHGDNRGYFERMFCVDELAAVGWKGNAVQVNHSMTAQQGTVRGMHFQYPPHTEQKLVSCVRGAVWDVAVDIRRDSPTFLQWHAETLTADGGEALFIPCGFAHGFQTLARDTEMIYCHSAAFEADFEGGINPVDPQLKIAWPQPISALSDRDRSSAFFTPDFIGFVA